MNFRRGHDQQADGLQPKERGRAEQKGNEDFYHRVRKRGFAIIVKYAYLSSKVCVLVTASP